MRPSQIAEKLRILLPEREPVLITGAPGVGKTQTVAQILAELEYDMVLSHAVTSDPTDIKGMPAVVHDSSGKASGQFLPFELTQIMIEATKPTAIVFDDVGQAMPAVQGAIMQPIHGGKINGHKISEHIRFIAITNRRADKAGVQGLITPLLDRFTVILPYDFNLEDWQGWYFKQVLPGVVVAWTNFRPEIIGSFEATKDLRKSPTPRSVAGLARLIKNGAIKHHINDLEVAQGAIGEAPGSDFMAFFEVWTKLPDRNTIYANPDSVPVPEELSVQHALMGSLAYGMTKNNIEATLKFLKRCSREMAVRCVKQATVRDVQLANHPAFLKFAFDHKEAFGFS